MLILALLFLLLTLLCCLLACTRCRSVPFSLPFLHPLLPLQMLRWSCFIRCFWIWSGDSRQWLLHNSESKAEGSIRSMIPFYHHQNTLILIPTKWAFHNIFIAGRRSLRRWSVNVEWRIDGRSREEVSSHDWSLIYLISCRITTDVTTREIRTTTYTDEQGNTHVTQEHVNFFSSGR